MESFEVFDVSPDISSTLLPRLGVASERVWWWWCAWVTRGRPCRREAALTARRALCARSWSRPRPLPAKAVRTVPLQLMLEKQLRALPAFLRRPRRPVWARNPVWSKAPSSVSKEWHVVAHECPRGAGAQPTHSRLPGGPAALGRIRCGFSSLEGEVAG